MSDRDLLAVGFVAGNDGTLHAPDTSHTTLTPTARSSTS